jgi:hypothetical protein
VQDHCDSLVGVGYGNETRIPCNSDIRKELGVALIDAGRWKWVALHRNAREEREGTKYGCCWLQEAGNFLIGLGKHRKTSSSVKYKSNKEQTVLSKRSYSASKNTPAELCDTRAVTGPANPIEL